jgi:hypothetical protein
MRGTWEAAHGTHKNNATKPKENSQKITKQTVMMLVKEGVTQALNDRKRKPSEASHNTEVKNNDDLDLEDFMIEDTSDDDNEK